MTYPPKFSTRRTKRRLYFGLTVVLPLIVLTSLAADDPEIGREVAIARHLQDGEEFTVPLNKLLRYGRENRGQTGRSPILLTLRRPFLEKKLGNVPSVPKFTESSTQGDTVIKVTYTVNSQSASASSQGITVHKPTSLKTVSTVPNDHTTTCTLPCLLNPGKGTCTVKSGTSCNYTEPITRRNYSVVDKWGNLFEDVQLSGVTITESVTASQGSCGGNNVEIASTGGSPFHDDFGKCDSCCEAGGPGCTSTATQTLSANGFSVRSENITVTCTSATLTP